MTDEEERAAILAAMERLLAGTPLRSSGNLDIISLAEEAGLKRNKLTHKHTDLKDRFYTERRARQGMTDRQAQLHDEIAQLKARIDELREERDNYRTANEVFARALHALTIENDNLRRNTTRIAEAESHRWYGEAEGLKVSLAGAHAKLAQIDQISARRTHAVQLGIPSFTDTAGRTTTDPTPPARRNP